MLSTLMSLTIYAQTAQVKKLTIADGDSISSSVVLKDEVIPISVWIDSLTTNTTLKLQVGFNNSLVTAPTIFYDICSKSDTNAYSINLREDRVIPLELTYVYPAIGTFTNQSTQVWIRGVLGAHQDNGKFLFVRLSRMF